MSASRQTLCFTILILNQKLVGRSPSGVLLITVAKEKTSLKDVELRTTNSVAQKWHMLCQLADHWPALVKWTVQPQRGLKMQFYHRRRWWKGVNTWWTAVMTLVAALSRLGCCFVASKDFLHHKTHMLLHME